jgi:hypothetical protein
MLIDNHLLSSTDAPRPWHYIIFSKCFNNLWLGPSFPSLKSTWMKSRRVPEIFLWCWIQHVPHDHNIFMFNVSFTARSELFDPKENIGSWNLKDIISVCLLFICFTLYHNPYWVWTPLHSSHEVLNCSCIILFFIK